MMSQWNPHDYLSAERHYGRREFLRSFYRAGIATAISTQLPRRAWARTNQRHKIVVATFGGGARDEETFSPQGQENIPHLLGELIPQATFFTQVVNRGILGHYVATSSLATGVYERFDNFADVAPQHPTIFEYYRKDLRRPATDAWVVAPSNGFDHLGQSSEPKYRGEGAIQVLPKQLLTYADGSAAFSGLEHLLNDNYESPLQSPVLLKSEMPAGKLQSLLNLSAADFAAHAASLKSPDELSLFIAQQVMREVSPRLLWVTFHDIDVAHAGAFSLYVEAIRRCDKICGELWRTIQSDPEYKDRTNLLILPDFGRDSDEDAGGNGFQHHRTGDALSRTTWLMALGPEIRQNAVVNRPIDSLDLAPTLAAMLGCDARMARGKPIEELGL